MSVKVCGARDFLAPAAERIESELADGILCFAGQVGDGAQLWDSDGDDELRRCKVWACQVQFEATMIAGVVTHALVDTGVPECLLPAQNGRAGRSRPGERPGVTVSFVLQCRGGGPSLYSMMGPVEARNFPRTLATICTNIPLSLFGAGLRCPEVSPKYFSVQPISAYMRLRISIGIE
jgi:hypothetical protein